MTFTLASTSLYHDDDIIEDGGLDLGLELDEEDIPSPVRRALTAIFATDLVNILVHGIVLLSAYSLGFSIPFFLTSL